MTFTKINKKDNECSSINSKEKANVIFDEYEEVDKFFSKYSDIKKWANQDKLYKQYYDYKWNYNRIYNDLKPHFLEIATRNFNNYRENNELSELFYSKISNDDFKSLLLPY